MWLNVRLMFVLQTVMQEFLPFAAATKEMADNFTYLEEWDEDYLKFNYSHPCLAEDTISSNGKNSCLYSVHFISCIKWPLVRGEDFMLYDNNSALYISNNYTYHHDFDYSPEHYKLSSDHKIAYVCVPENLNAYLHPIDYAYVAVWSISLFFLLLSVVVHIWVVRNLRQASVYPMICHQLSLILFYLFLNLLNTNALGDSGWMWDWANIGSYFSLRAAFSWLNVISFDMWRTFHPQRVLLYSQSNPSVSTHQSFFYQSLYGWGLPVLMLLIAYLLLYLPIPKTEIVSNGGPLYVNIGQLVWMRASVTFIVFINGVFCTFVVFNLRRIRKDIAQSKLVTDAHQQRYSIYLKIVVMSGLLWIIETVQWVIIRYEHFFVYWLIPDWLTCGQGLWLFLIYCCNKPVLTATVNKIKKLCS